MKMKKTVLSAIILIMSLSFLSASAWAGSKERYRWEGVAIGVGAALVGGAINNSYARGPYAAPPAVVSVNYVEYPPAPVYCHYPEHPQAKCCGWRPYPHCSQKACRHPRHAHHSCGHHRHYDH